MPMQNTFFCLNCDELTVAGAFCKNCGNTLSVSADDFSKLIIRRLVSEGFSSTTAVFQGGEKLQPIAIALKDQIEKNYESVLMFPATSGGSNSVHTLNIVGILYADGQKPSEINEIAILTYDVVRDTVKNFEGFKILATFIRVYVIYKGGCSLETVQSHKLPWKKRKAIKPNVQLNVIPIDCEQKKTYGGSKFIEPDMNVELSLKQVGKITGPSKKSSFYFNLTKLIFEKPFQIFVDYMRSMALVGNPPILAYRIATNKLSAKDLFGIFGISAFLAAIIANVFHINMGGFKLGFSLIDSILDNILIIVTYMFSAFIYHLPLRLAGGTATFRSTFIATGYTGAVAQPLGLLFVGVMTSLGVPAEEAWRSAPIGSLVIMLPVFSALHQLSLNRILFLLVFLWPLAIMTVVFAIIFLFDLLG